MEFDVWYKSSLCLILCIGIQLTGWLTIHIFWPILGIYIIISFGYMICRLDLQMRKYKYKFNSLFKKVGQV